MRPAPVRVSFRFALHSRLWANARRLRRSLVACDVIKASLDVQHMPRLEGRAVAGAQRAPCWRGVAPERGLRKLGWEAPGSLLRECVCVCVSVQGRSLWGLQRARHKVRIEVLAYIRPDMSALRARIWTLVPRTGTSSPRVRLPALGAHLAASGRPSSSRGSQAAPAMDLLLGLSRADPQIVAMPTGHIQTPSNFGRRRLKCDHVRADILKLSSTSAELP